MALYGHSRCVINRRVVIALLACVVLWCAACGRQRGPAREGAESSNKGSGQDMTEDQDAAGGQPAAGEQGGGAVIYAAIGDSTGVGVGARSGGGYVARLFTRLERVRPNSRLVNLCVSGADTEDLLRGQLQRAIAARPTLVTVGIGINDIGHGFTAERFARNYEQIVARLKAETKARIVVTNIPDISLAPVAAAFNPAEVRRMVNSFNERIADIAGRHGLLLVDAYTVTHDVIPQHPEFFSEDGFHPSAEGYEYWAKTMWPAVKEAIGER